MEGRGGGVELGPGVAGPGGAPEADAALRRYRWVTKTQRERSKLVREIVPLVLQRGPKLCNFIEYKDMKIVYKRYASLYFACIADPSDNELIALEAIHHFVHCLDRYFGNVCELDLVFNFHKAYYIVDEIFLGGELQETSKKAVEHFIVAQDALVEQAQLGGEDVAQVHSTGRA